MTWDVAVTTIAPPEVVRHFAAVYHALGAEVVHIHYDDPSAEILALDGVRETVCSPDHWHGRRPDAVEHRQMFNARRAADASDAEWLLQCDIDEHLAVQPGADTVAAALAALPGDCHTIIVPAVEAVYLEPPKDFLATFATPWFKAHTAFNLSKSFWGARYGDRIELTNAGYWAHRRGKPFVRIAAIDADQFLPLHNYKGPLAARMGQVRTDALRLRHYDAQPVDSWMRKHLSRLDGTVNAPMMGDKRQRQAELIRDTAARGKADLVELYRQMYCVDPSMLVAGINMGTIVTVPAGDCPALTSGTEDAAGC